MERGARSEVKTTVFVNGEVDATVEAVKGVIKEFVASLTKFILTHEKEADLYISTNTYTEKDNISLTITDSMIAMDVFEEVGNLLKGIKGASSNTSFTGISIILTIK